MFSLNYIESLGLNKAVLPQRKHTDIMNTDLQSIYRAQISALWDNVEGSQVKKGTRENE